MENERKDARMARLGCLLMIVAFFGLCGLVVLPVMPFMSDDTVVDDLLEEVLCESDERIRRDQYVSSNRQGETSYSMSVYCVNERGLEREVTDDWMGVSMLGFLLPFIAGLFLLIFGVSRAVGKANKTVLAPQPVEAKAGGDIAIPTFNVGGRDDSTTLSRKLYELQEARNKGKISEADFARLRDEVLSKGL